MDVISEESVEDVWQEVALLKPDQMVKAMNELSKQQPYLLAFMLEFTRDLDQEVIELAVYMFYNIHRMFKKNYQKRIKRIPIEDIVACYKQNEQFIESLNGINEKMFDRIAGVQLSKQPYVMKYVLETLFEAPESEDPITLTEEDTGYLFLLFKTIIDLLNDKTNA